VTAPARTQYAVASPYGAQPTNFAPTARSDYRPPASTTYPPYSPPSAATPSSIYRVQAGAFSDPGRAQQVADQLAGAGPTRVESVQRDTGTIYRVILQASNDEGEAWALRDRVAAYGYADARVLRPF
jgi:rare lipoprotein A